MAGRPPEPGRGPAGPDYRDSHVAPGKGRSYHAAFSTNPYRRMIWEMEKKVLDRIVEECPRRDGRLRHLDFACGTGRILSYIAPLADVSVGVDVSAEMLAVAREGGGKSEILEADLTRHDALEGREFDLITAFRFFPNAQPALRDEVMDVLVRHLDADGRLVLNNHKNAASLRYRLARLGRRGGFDGMDPAEVRDLAARHGLEIERVGAMGFTPAGEERLIQRQALLRAVETSLAALRPLWPLAENAIYVCRRR